MIYDSVNNFYFDDNKGMLIEKDGYKSYTFTIRRNENDQADLENLVFAEKENHQFDSYLVKYDYSIAEAKLMTNNQLFQQSSEGVEFTNLFERMSICIEISVSACSEDPYDCHGSVCGFKSKTICEAGGGTQDNGAGGSIGGSSGSTGGTGGTSGGGSSGDGGGAPPINTTPVVPPQLVNNGPNPCISLNKIIDPALTGNINGALNLVLSEASSPNTEKEYGASLTCTDGNYNSSPLPTSNNSNGDSYSIPISIVPNMYGAIHSHPTDAQIPAAPTFSFSDLFQLKRIYASATTQNQQDVVFFLALPNGEVYALKIDNIDGFTTFLNSYLEINEVLDEMNQKKKFKKMNRIFDENCKYSNPNRGFLQAITGSGLSFYKKTGDSYGFKKLELPDNPNTAQLKETNCN